MLLPASPLLLSEEIHTLGLVLDIWYDKPTERLFLACGEGGPEIWDLADPATGWVVGAHGTILGTTDGGSSWQPQDSGTVPFETTMTALLTNLHPELTRRLAGRIEVTLAGGNQFPNWRSGTTNVDPGSSYLASWNTTIPAIPPVIGDNLFQLVVEDVTPAPYNQPPYPPAGDTDLDGCTVRGMIP